MKVTFETKCWEKDWELLLKTDKLQRMIELNCFPFDEKILLINNVTDYDIVCRYALKLVGKKIITSYIVVDDHADEALEFFGLKREDLGIGWFYSIAELVGIYLCRTDYLLHYSGDSILEKSTNWIDSAVKKMDSDDKIVVANPTWNRHYDEAKAESSQEDEGFYTGSGFSDQCYLIKAETFRGKIYGENNQSSERYPKYGGELFEKRVDAWMRNHNLLRITDKNISYIHPSR